MDLTAANSVIGNELHDGDCNENFSRSVHIDKEKEEDDVNSNNYNRSRSSNNNNKNSSSSSSSIKITTIATQQHEDLYDYNNQIQSMHQKEDILLLNSITSSEYHRRKKIREEEILNQKSALATTSKERKTKLKQAYNADYAAMNTKSKRAYNAAYTVTNTESKQAYNAAYTAMNTKSKQAYNAAYRAMTNAKIHAYQQLTSPKDKLLNCANDDNQEEQEKISKNRKDVAAEEIGEVVEGADTVVGVGDDSEELAAGADTTGVVVGEKKEGFSIGP